MSASDYMVGATPGGASYQPPNIGPWLAEQLASVPQTIFDASQRRLTRAKQNAFPDGMPTNPDGTPDVNSIINKGMQLGGLDYAGPLMQLMMQQNIGKQAAAGMPDPYNGGGGNPGGGNPAAAGNGTTFSRTPAPQASTQPQPPQPPRPSLSAAGPGNLTPPPQRLPQGDTASEGQDSVRSLATETFGGRDVSNLIPRFAQALKVNPDAPLTPQQLAAAKQIMSRTKLAQETGLVGQDMAFNPQQQQGGAPGAPQVPNPQAPRAPTAPLAPGAPAPGGGGTSGTPGTVPSTEPETAAPASGIMPNGPLPQQQPQPAPQQPQQSQPQQSPAQGLVPPGAEPLQYAQRLHVAALQARKAAAGYAPFNAATAQQYEKQADAYDAQAKQIMEAIAKERELTTEQKNASASGQQSPLDFTRAQEIQKADVTAGDKKYEGIQKQADDAHQLVQTLRLNQSLMDDPAFYSGVGEEYNLLWKRIKAAMGFAPNEAVPQEAFRKTVSSAILDQIRSLGGQGLGQVRVAEIKVMQSAAQNQDNTPAANRLLSEIQMRLATRWTVPLAQLAQAYKGGGTVEVHGKPITFQAHGYLDSGWDKFKADYINMTPLFSQPELDDTRRISPPLVRGNTPVEVAASLKKVGWHDGMPFRTPDGRIFTHFSVRQGVPTAQPQPAQPGPQ